MREGVTGLGGILIAVAGWLIADHLGMTGWKLWAIPVLLGLGVPMAVTGRLKGW